MGSVITLTLTLAAISIEGNVRLPNGKPAQSIVVAAIPRDGGWWSVAGVARTDSKGRFLIRELADGEYSLTVTSPRYTSAFVDRVAARADVRLKSGGHRLRGTARHANGDPLRGRVIARRLSDYDTDVFVLETGNDGSFSAMLPPARYRLYTEGADGRIETTVDLREGNADAHLRLERVFHVTPPAVVDWIRRNAVDPLAERTWQGIIDDASVVAFGEATHGTREFFDLRHQIFQMLVEKLRFRVLAIEANAFDTAAANDYVLGGKGSAEQAASSLRFWAWNTTELAETLRWMRQWNERTCVILSREDGEGAPRAGRSFALSGAQDDTPCLHIYGFDMQEPAAANDSLDPEWTRELVRQGEQLLRVTARANEVRDRFMAENVGRIRDLHPGSRMVIWAHNGHVAAEAPRLLGGESMGYHLREMFGDDLRIIGFAFDRGRVRAESPSGEIAEHEVGPARAASLDGALKSAGFPLMAIDLRRARGVVRSWLDSPVAHRTIGISYDAALPGNYWSAVHPSRSYDAIIFTAQSSPTRPVSSPASRDRPRSSAPQTAPGIR